MSLKASLEKISDIEMFWDSDLTNYSTFRLRSHGDLIVVKSEEALSAIVKVLNENNRSWRMIGWGANQVLLPKETDLLIQLNFKWDATQFEVARSSYHLPASLGLNHLTSHATKFGLKGWESLTGIPASLGGAIYMNAGTALGEIGALVRKVRLMNRKGEIREIEMNESSFSYRKNHFVNPGDIIISATLVHLGIDQAIPAKIKSYLEYRRNSQPLATKNCGCVFKNYSRTRQAGRLLDLTGLKGLAVGALRVSHRHANFMENIGGASSEDFHSLTELVNLQMRLHWGVEFELEVKAV
ncbi:MAG: UDP-N-acetylmuramate dehydrogenase [Bacteriovoracia bacterium]